MMPGEPAVDELLVRNELQKRGVNASSEWIQQAIQHVSSSTSSDSPSRLPGTTTTTTPQRQIADKVFSLYLLADLRTLAQKPQLPATKDTPHNQWLFGDKPIRPTGGGGGGQDASGSGVILQLLHIQDISISSLKMLELCESLGVAGDQPGGFQIGKALPRGMCLLELTDGFRKISAMEMEPIHDVGIEMKLGVKFLVKPMQNPGRHTALNAKYTAGSERVASASVKFSNSVDYQWFWKLVCTITQRRHTNVWKRERITDPLIQFCSAHSGLYPRMVDNYTCTPDDPSPFRRDPQQQSRQQQNDWPPATRKRPANQSVDDETKDLPMEEELDSRAYQWDADDGWGGIDQEPDWQGFDNDFDQEPFDRPDALDDTLVEESSRRSPSPPSPPSPPPTKPHSNHLPSLTLASGDRKTPTIDQHGKKLDPSFASTLPSTQRQRLSLKRPNRAARESPPIVKVDEAELMQHIKLEQRQQGQKGGENAGKSPLSSDGDVANDFERRLSVTRDVNNDRHSGGGMPGDDPMEDPDISMHTIKEEPRHDASSRLIQGALERSIATATHTNTSTSPSTKVTPKTEWAIAGGRKAERGRQESVVDLLSSEGEPEPEPDLFVGPGADGLNRIEDDDLMEEGLSRQEREELDRATRESLRLHQEYMATTDDARAAVVMTTTTTATTISTTDRQEEDENIRDGKEEAMDVDTVRVDGDHHHLGGRHVEEFDLRGLDPNAFAGLDYDHLDYPLEQHEIPTQVLPRSQAAGGGTQERVHLSQQQQPSLPARNYSNSPTHHPRDNNNIIISNNSSSSNGHGNSDSSRNDNSRRTSDREDDDDLVEVKQERTLFEMDDTEDEDDVALLDADGVAIKKEAVPLVPLSDVLSSVERGLEVRAKAQLVRMGRFSVTTVGASLLIYLVPPKQGLNTDDSEGGGGSPPAVAAAAAAVSASPFRLEAQLESGVVEKMLGMSSAVLASLVEGNRRHVAREVNAMKQGLMNVELVECRFHGLRKNVPIVREFTILARR
ncbi:hypothetical protein DFQ27_001567 [Actinomortierella ambigua]|uniref:RecQ-mediated genome instability protein 1 n=1 Tax=Actinomortierella ambigua TaxID=1343610 RepID=A0A9P6QDK5_9FUNG|nr:hypothetical protein DFQ27_001567 [Actinomortierella ambigua]